MYRNVVFFVLSILIAVANGSAQSAGGNHTTQVTTNNGYVTCSVSDAGGSTHGLVHAATLDSLFDGFGLWCCTPGYKIYKIAIIDGYEY
ncbi:MAG: hypothetical protein HY606_00650 [Planctomycetes bacterium]|nr:hypothetical protein [Planctomycetota bacterium]